MEDLAVELGQKGSPSSRRAWIEIYMFNAAGSAGFVALLAEGVDRNNMQSAIGAGAVSRPPRGGRG